MFWQEASHEQPCCINIPKYRVGALQRGGSGSEAMMKVHKLG